MLRTFYNHYIFEYPKTVLLLIILIVGFLGYEATKLEIDASAETLILENDKDLQFTRMVNERYWSPDSFVITYTPKKDGLLSDATLSRIGDLKKDLLKLKGVESVTSMLDVPLLESPVMPITDLLKSIPTLETPGIDRKLVKQEFLTSPIYERNLVSPDFKTTALLANFPDDVEYRTLLKKRNALRQKQRDKIITSEEIKELNSVQLEFKTFRDKARIEQHINVEQVRAILEKYRDHADLFLGGVAMISDDLVTFVKDDLTFFGVGVLLFLIITLKLIFRETRWIFLPIICCALSVIATSGFLGLFAWEVTVISSNFISIQIIITMALTIHLTVRYRELLAADPHLDQRQLVLDTVVFMAKPCAYAILTTCAGFGSLIISDILPISDFGWMMSVGIIVSLFLTFLIFPVILILLKKLPPPSSSGKSFPLTVILANTTRKHGTLILVFSFLLAVFSGIGASKLRVENSFIDYFKQSTEIYQGMKVIDQQLGGTTSLDIVIDFDAPDEPKEIPTPAETEDKGILDEEEMEDEDLFDDFEEEFESVKNDAQYWFTQDKMETIEKVHDYLESIPEVGKVLSLATLQKVGKVLNEGEPFDNFMWALVYNKLPEEFRKIILSPYVSVEHNQVRITTRIIDSDPDLRRNELLKKIKFDLTDKLGIDADRVRLANILVLYNNMLQSLFASQILTLGVVLIVLMVMFVILFRSIKISLIAIIPNAISVAVVLGFMGWANIPLDLMTITIAAISVGIAVDDTIHYIHRFKVEFEKDHNYIASMQRCHNSIGHAMYFTSVIIIIGFSILVFSSFIPTIYFGLLTGLAMLIALIAALTLLPQLIIVMKPFGAERT